MTGILSQPYIPGLTDLRVAEADAQRRGANDLNRAMGILKIQEAKEEMEMRPLKRALLQAKVDEAKRLAGILNIYGGQTTTSQSAPLSFGEGGVSLPGGGQGNVNTGEVVPASAPTPQTPGQLPAHVRAALLHPKLAPLGKVEAEMYKPTDKMREANALGYAPGSPEFNAHVGTQFNQGGAWTVAPGGGVRLAPGYAEGRGAIERQEQGARADYDLVTVPSTAPNQPPTYRSRGELLRGIPQSPIPQAPLRTTASNDAEALRVVQDAERSGTQASVTVPRPGGAIPTNRVVPPNAAGMSPAAAAAQGASRISLETTARERAESGVKYETSVLEAGAKARTNLTQLQILAPNLDKLPTGPLYPMILGAQNYLQQFGIKVDEKLGAAQATDAVLKQLAMKLRDPAGGGGMPGALSDADRVFLTNALPNLTKAPDGNRQLMNILMSLEQRKIDEASIVAAMQRDGKDTNEIRAALQQFANSRPMFAR